MSDDAKPWDLINGSARTPEEIALSRLEICKGCDFFEVCQTKPAGDIKIEVRKELE
jgi:hypothetical protein